MQISLRSHLIAGTAVALAAGVVATIPSLPVEAPLAAPSTARVELAALANPIEAVLLSGGLAAFWLFDPYLLTESDYPPNYPLLTAGWIPNIVLGNPQVGLGPFPVVSQLVANILDYAEVAVAGQLDAIGTAFDGLVNLPGGLLTAPLLAADGQAELALETLRETLVDPVVAAVTQSLGGLLYPVFGVIQRGTAALAATVELVVDTVTSVIANAGLVFRAVERTFTGIVDNLGDGNFEGAWNFAVNGLLGITLPNADGSACTNSGTCAPAIPAQLIRSGLGGLSNFPLPAGEPFINGIRATVAQGIQNTARALAEPVVIPSASAATEQPTPAAARSVAASATPPAPQADAGAPVTVDDAATLTKTDVVKTLDAGTGAGAGTPTVPAADSPRANRSSRASAEAPAAESPAPAKYRVSRKAVTRAAE